MDTPRNADPRTPPTPPPVPPSPEPPGPHWRAIVAWIVTILAAALAGWVHGNSCGCRLDGPRLDLPPIHGEQNSVLPHADAQADELVPMLGIVAASDGDGQGWLGERMERAAGRSLDCTRMSDTPAGRAARARDDDEGDPDVFLWLAAVRATGAVLPAKNQNPVGSCVAFGNTAAHNYLQCMQVVHHRAEQYHELCEESLYGLMRHQVGHDRIRGDGGVGIWAAQAAKDYGVLARSDHVGGKYDLSRYDPNRCRAWGRSGPPAELLDLIREHPVKDFAQCQSAEDCRAALRSGYPIAVCSDVGFAGPRGGATQRDKDGFAPARGSWAHCMAILGYRGAPRRGFLIQQSWGPKAATGPTYPAAGDAGAPPDGTWWADWSVVDRMARQNGTFAFSDLVGFPVQSPWIVRRHVYLPRHWCLRLRVPEIRRAA